MYTVNYQTVPQIEDNETFIEQKTILGVLGSLHKSPKLHDFQFKHLHGLNDQNTSFFSVIKGVHKNFVKRTTSLKWQ